MSTDIDRASADRREPANGVIHDLGYRRYEGPRLGRGYIRRSLFVDGLKGAFGIGRTARSKIMPFLLLAAISLPALFMVVVSAVTGFAELAEPTTYVFMMQVVVAIYVAGQAPVSVSRDLRFSVMSLYLSRPMDRIDYVVAKYAALSAAVFVLVATPLLILFVGALLIGLPLGDQLPDHLRALVGAALVALLVAGIGLVIASVTPRRGIGVAAIVTVLLVLAGVQAMAQDIAWTQGADGAAAYLGLMAPFTLVDGVQSALLGAESIMLTAPEGTAVGLLYLAVTVLVLVTCFVALLLRYRKVSVS